MLSKFNKIISILLTIVFITGIFPPVVFAGPNPAPLGEVKGFNRTVIDSHFSRADREINPEQWLAEAKFGITQAICAWELIAGSLYENPLLFEEAKAQIEKWSDEELEKRFSQWLMGRFFGKAAEEALINLSSMFSESQKNYSWHLDEAGNVIFDTQTGDPLVVRPNEEGREFSNDLALWRNDTDKIVKTTGASLNNVMASLYPELLAYIPAELRDSMSAIISESLNIQRNVIKQEFENIAAREERIFTNRRTRDIWSLRKKNDDEAARIFTEKLIAQTDEVCKKGIEELNIKIEQALAGAGDLAILGEEWLRLYKEQFERGLKAWEDAEERFFIRRIEWEQESFKLFSEGEEIWLSAFNQFEEQRQKWELSAKELFQTGETLFKNISDDLEKTIAEAKKEFELNIAIRIGEGTNKVKALIDMYIVSSSAAASSIENIKFWQKQYGNDEKNIRDSDFSDWILQEIENLWRQTESAYLNDPEYINDCVKLQALENIRNLDASSPVYYFSIYARYGRITYDEYLIEFNKKYSGLFKAQEILKEKTPLSEQIDFSKNMDTKYFPKFKFEALIEMQSSYKMYLLYAEKSLDARDRIYENYAELFGTGALKDIFSSDVSSDDFFLDEYQIALIRAKALVLYWERKTSIADAIIAYAGELSAGRMTEAEGLRAWEEAKAAYNKSLADYEIELSKLNKTGEDIQKQQEILYNMTLQMQKEEETLNNLYSEYSSLVSMSVVNLNDYYYKEFNTKYNDLVEKHKKYQNTGVNSVYFSAINYGLLWEITEQREAAEIINYLLENSGDLSEEEIEELYNKLNTLNPELQNELWRNTCNSLSLLFDDYGLETEGNIIPDVQSICLAIFDKPGDFAENTAKFLTDFDNCFSTIHKWLQYEIDNWKEAVIEYITIYALFYNIQPEKNTTELADIYNNLLAEYNDLYQYAITYTHDVEEEENVEEKDIEEEDVEKEDVEGKDIEEEDVEKGDVEERDDEEKNDDVIEQINNAFKEIYYKLKMYDYIYKISESWELMNSIASTENKTNWRQYLSDSYITNKDPALVMVSSWKTGILEDALYYAFYYTNRINDSFNIYSQKDIYNTNENAEQLYNLYYEEIRQILFDFNLLNSQYNEIINAARLLGFSELSIDDFKDQLLATEEAIKIQEEAVNLFRDNYYREAEIFLNIGSQYDNQYNVLKIAYNNTDQKRFEYEKQDAIQKWAGTSYLNTDNIDPDNCRANLLKAQTVLKVLSDISNSNNSITYNNPEYEALYSAYEQSFTKKLKTLEAIEMLSSAYTEEMIHNKNIHNEYQKALFQLGINFDYKNYTLPDSRSEWKLENIITVKNGRLAFSRNDAMYITGVNSTESNSVIDFFTATEPVSGEKISITAYEEALRGLSQRLPEYLRNRNKFEQWSYARNYLLLSLKNANGDLNFLNNYLSFEGNLFSIGPLASELIILSPFEKSKTLSEYMDQNYFNSNGFSVFQNAWNGLSAEEKADLEFYVILTLTTGYEYFAGFKEMYTYNAYAHLEGKTSSLSNEAHNIMKSTLWFNPIFWAWFDMREINKNTNRKVSPVASETYNIVNKWINGLQNNLNSIQNSTALYTASCQKLKEIEGIKTEGQKINWEDLALALSNTKIKPEDVNELKTCWETMQNNTSTAYQNVNEAFIGLLYWTEGQLNNSKNNLETRFASDMQKQQSNEEYFLSIVDDYFNGTADIKKVKTAAENAYVKNTIPSKYFLNNMYGSLFNNLSMYTNADFNFNSLFSGIGEEITLLTEEIIFNKYNAELTTRETEWNMTRKDIAEKYNEWQNTAAQILENGRTDWTESYKKLESAYKQWNLNFQSEYERVNDEWAYAYLAGLEDKEKWLQQAADAANQASSESFLSLVGTEGERLSRFVDTREPFGIRDAVPEAQALMANLLQSSGIVNMANIFNSINTYTGITSPLVKRGVGGGSAWNSAFVKAEASELARKTNADIVNAESKKIAYSARMAADEAIKDLTANVNVANQNFRESMDNLFIFKGLWRKSGNNYVKDITKGSTVFEPVVTQSVTIQGYQNYIMEPVTLRTKLDEEHLVGLTSIAIQELINNAYAEVQTIANDILGTDKEAKIIPKTIPEVIFTHGELTIKIDEKVIERKLSPGKFGAHIGYGPASTGQSSKNRNEMFYDEGIGELGHLLSDYQYWYAIDQIGSAELSIAPWDKRMWNDEGSSFQAPNLRTVGAIVGTIVAAAVSYGVGGVIGIALSVGISSATEITLGSLDVAYEYKPVDEVAVSVGKTVLINTVTSVAGSAFNGIKNTSILGLTNTAVEKASPGLGKVLAKTFMTGTQTVTTGIATNAISGITYDSENGFGYSGAAFSAGMKGTLTSALTSMASTFTTTGLTEINTGLDSSKSKVEGFNPLNKSDMQNLNGLIGSIAGEGANYALGNDFTLNVLNLGLLTDNKHNSGLLELHLGRDGVSMNIGTSGANVSIDNLISVYRGAQVWDVNTKISKAGKANNFDALIALRIQYGYGDNRQKEQLWDILNGKAIIDTEAEGKNVAETTINEDGKRVIKLVGYKEGMSKEEQYLLGAILGYEAYRDGYIPEEIDANGNLVTLRAQSDEFKTASIAKLMMADRIQEENNWFYKEFEGLAYESILLEMSKQSGDFSLFDDYLELTYNNDKDYFYISASNGNDYQNYYSSVLLFNSVYKDTDKEAEINEKRFQAAFQEFVAEKCPNAQGQTYQELYEEFKSNNKIQKRYGYRPVSTTTISDVGCMFMSTKYGIEAITGKQVNTLALHYFIKTKGYFADDNILSRWLMADIMTAYTNKEYSVKYMEKFGESPTLETLNKIESPDEKYVIHLRVKDPSKTDPIIHSVMVSDIEYTYDDNRNITGISKVYVANPLKSDTHFNGRSFYLPNEIDRWDIFLVTENKK
jgi:hypothetical protein